MISTYVQSYFIKTFIFIKLLPVHDQYVQSYFFKTFIFIKLLPVHDQYVQSYFFKTFIIFIKLLSVHDQIFVIGVTLLLFWHVLEKSIDVA
jgi:hypothetical protein